MARGIARQLLFRPDADREDFVGRVATVATAPAWTVSTWTALARHPYSQFQKPLAYTLHHKFILGSSWVQPDGGQAAA